MLASIKNLRLQKKVQPPPTRAFPPPPKQSCEWALSHEHIELHTRNEQNMESEEGNEALKLLTAPAIILFLIWDRSQM